VLFSEQKEKLRKTNRKKANPFFCHSFFIDACQDETKNSFSDQEMKSQASSRERKQFFSSFSFLKIKIIIIIPSKI